MGLDVLDKVPPRVAKPNLVVDLSALAGEGAQITFREPRTADMVMGTAPREALRAGFAEFSDDLLATILLMGACYVPDANETGTISPARRLANLVRGSVRAACCKRRLVRASSAAISVRRLASCSDDSRNLT